MAYLTALFLSLFATISLIPLLIKFSRRLEVFDIPNARKVHAEPIPRIGGIAIAIGVFVPLLLWWTTEDTFLRTYTVGAGIIVCFGILDDLKGLDYKLKFLGQITAALIVVYTGGLKITKLGVLLPDGVVLPVWVSILFTVVLIVGITNAINLADGLDGLAGGICLLSFCCIGYLAYIQGDTTLTLISLSLTGAIFGFLRFNTHPASLFMGDTGSQFLGFSLVTTSLALTQGNTALSPVLPLIIFGFPVLDTITVMLKRITQGHSPFLADNQHFHHRLLCLGLWHTESVFVIYVLQAIFITAAFIFRFYSEWTILFAYGSFAGLIIFAFFLANITGFRLNRHSIFDTVLKKRLKMLKEECVFIIVFFKIVEFGLPLLLFVTCILPRSIPANISVISLVLMAILLLAWFFRKDWLRRSVVLSLYFLIPVVVYLSTDNPRLTGDQHYIISFYNFFYVFLAFFVVLTLNLTKRKRGFRITTMDFLILFITLAAPYIAGGTHMAYKEVASIAAKTVMLFFSYEVLIGELRNKMNRLAFATVCSLSLIALRGFVGM